MATKEQAVEIMVEAINIMQRQSAVHQKQDLVELEKQLIAVQPQYRQMCTSLYDTLVLKGVITSNS
jgi:polyhydroxyalkanoate synthesis regulator phasin